ncbi:MAG: sigma-70 family RNA polymerase sigma factor [Terracidiphilus sp.]|jgi:RNA polymerase sigma-70 factor (ECF subfamily)
MELCSSPAFHGINNEEDSPSRDLELVAAARLGSNAAFEELQSRYSSRLYWRIHSITKNREDAEDVLQETFLRAYTALDSFEGRSQFATWITRIAINSALMVLRRRRHRPEVSFELASECGETAAKIDVRDTALNPEQHYDLRQRSEIALRAIGKLNIKLRTPMATWIKQDCSIKEVARTLDLPMATVKSRLHRARKRLTRSTVFNGRVQAGDRAVAG